MNGKRAKELRAWAEEFPNLPPKAKVHKRVKLFPSLREDGSTVMLPTKVEMIQLIYPNNSARRQYQWIKKWPPVSAR